MTTATETQLGRFSVEVELANNDDLARVRSGDLAPQQVRRATVCGVVDSGAMRLVIPETLAKQLGLSPSGSVKVRYADGRTAERPTVQGVHLTYGGRDGIFTAIVEPSRDSALIGAIVLEDLDFLVDCWQQRLVPRDPDHIISEIE